MLGVKTNVSVNLGCFCAFVASISVQCVNMSPTEHVTLSHWTFYHTIKVGTTC